MDCDCFWNYIFYLQVVFCGYNEFNENHLGINGMWLLVCHWLIIVKKSPKVAKHAWCVTKHGKFAENKQIFKSEPHLLVFHAHLQFSNKYGFGLVQTATKSYWRHFIFFVSLICLPHVLFRRAPVFVLLIIKLSLHSTSFFKVRKALK